MLSISQRCNFWKWEKGSIWVRKYERKNKKEKVEAKVHRGVLCTSQLQQWPCHWGQKNKAGSLCSQGWHVFAILMSCLYVNRTWSKNKCSLSPPYQKMISQAAFVVFMSYLLRDTGHSFGFNIHCNPPLGRRTAKSLLSHRWPQWIWSLKCWLGSPLQPGRGFTEQPHFWEPFF